MATHTPSAPPQVSLRILVVDDVEDAAESLALVLRLQGHQARAAFDGAAALALAQEFLPQVILLDLGLPKIDGYQLASQLRQFPSSQNACLIAVTGYGQDADIQRAKEAGFHHHLLKPIELTQLAILLKSAIPNP